MQPDLPETNWIMQTPVHTCSVSAGEDLVTRSQTLKEKRSSVTKRVTSHSLGVVNSLGLRGVGCSKLLAKKGGIWILEKTQTVLYKTSHTPDMRTKASLLSPY